MASKRPAVRCRAHNRAGEPCRNYAMVGGAVCHAHGGRAPQVRAAARRRRAQAMAWGTLRRFRANQEAQRAALEPWADELRQVRRDAAAGVVDPWTLARHAKDLARQMSTAARILREYARVITAEREGR